MRDLRWDLPATSLLPSLLAKTLRWVSSWS